MRESRITGTARGRREDAHVPAVRDRRVAVPACHHLIDEDACEMCESLGSDQQALERRPAEDCYRGSEFICFLWRPCAYLTYRARQLVAHASVTRR
jgi:hypothetical protein